MVSAFRFARIAGIEVVVDGSVLAVSLLLLLNVGVIFLPAWHPDWSYALDAVTALGVAILFFVSVLAHEMAHAVAARLQGTQVDSIALYAFGGIAHLEHEPRGWRREVATALVGPATSFLIAGLAVFVVTFSTRGLPFDPAFPESILGELGPEATLFLWLGQINLALAMFNLIPGFPLDGGRVLRAVLWAAGGDLRRATLHAIVAGQAFSWLLIFAGLAMAVGLRVPLLGSGLIGGLWVIMAGWFLNSATLACRYGDPVLAY